jgi:AcrR family transcriptional regulator
MARKTKAKGKQVKPAKAGTLSHGEVMQAAARVDPVLRRRSELLWEDRVLPTRGPKPGLTPQDVVDAAIAIADEEGVLTAVSMHAVAARLGFTTMALYRYFPGKEALYDAIVDAGMGLPPASMKDATGWRERITQWAFAKRSMLCARPWLAELPFTAAPHGPNWLSWLEALTAPLRSTGLAPADVGQMISVIDGYVRGASDTAISLARARMRGVSAQEWAAAVGADLGRAIGDPRFGNFAWILAAPSDGKDRTMEEGFGFGLERVLDGIEAYLPAANPA